MSADDALRVLESLRRQGRIVLLLDALDQAPPDGGAVQVLHSLLEDHEWHACRIVVSGRPHALQRHWERLFATSLGFGWRFVQLDEFDPDQQRRFLGRTHDGRERYGLIPETAREILSTPRVLEYLRDLPDRELEQIRTAGDVYWHSINHLLKEGMKNSEPARHLGLSPDERTPATVQARSLARGRELLGAIAFRMTSTLTPPRRAARRANWCPTLTASRRGNSSGSRTTCTSCWRGVRARPTASTWTGTSTAWPR